MSHVAYQARAYPGFRSVKRLGIFLLPPGWDVSVLPMNTQRTVYFRTSLYELTGCFPFDNRKVCCFFSRETRTFQEERLQKERLLQQKRNELEKCKNNLQEATSKAVKLRDEVEKERKCISQLRYNLANTLY